MAARALDPATAAASRPRGNLEAGGVRAPARCCRRPSRRRPRGDLEVHLRGDLAFAQDGEEGAHGAATFAEHPPEGVATLEEDMGGAPGGGVLGGSTEAASNQGLLHTVLLRVESHALKVEEREDGGAPRGGWDADDRRIPENARGEGTNRKMQQWLQ